MSNILHTAWNDVIHTEQRIIGEFENLHDLVSENIQRWSASPKLLLPLYKTLREHSPIFKAGSVVIVTLDVDAREVLARQADFTVTEIYDERMSRTSGRFYLGMEDGDVYRRESTFTRNALGPADLPRIVQIIEGAAAAVMAQARPTGSLELVGGLTRIVPARLVRDFFGVAGPDEPTLLRWLRTIFWEIFLNPTNVASVREAAERSSREMHDHLLALITERRREIAAGSTRDDFVTRLVRAQEAAGFSDDDVRRNIGGVIVGAVETTSQAVVGALGWLLDHPEPLASAQAAARAGDDEAVAGHVFEALRGNPQTPLLVRCCPREATIARGTPRETVVPAGGTVIVATLSAMHDPAAVEAPEEFRKGRADAARLHWGDGLHRCFGDIINRKQIPAIAKHVLALPNLRRAESGGDLRWEGPFPDRFVVDFDPS